MNLALALIGLIVAVVGNGVDHKFWHSIMFWGSMGMCVTGIIWTIAASVP